MPRSLEKKLQEVLLTPARASLIERLWIVEWQKYIMNMDDDTIYEGWKRDAEQPRNIVANIYLVARIDEQDIARTKLGDDWLRIRMFKSTKQHAVY